tara:strand:- start:268 stop:912 length:645 start_codon:yes stop_codon:yes gene_type:complete
MRPLVTMDQVIDFAAECNTPPDGYFSTWDVLGRWQIDALTEIGLKPDHNVLDIGCGALRLGVFALPYLTVGKYCGVDAFEGYIKIAKKIQHKLGQEHNFDVRLDHKFEFEAFEINFDFAIAQSVFTHLSSGQIKECLRKLHSVTTPGAKFLATVSPIGPIETVGLLYGGVYPMQRPVPESIEEYIKPGEDEGFTVEVTNLTHPTGQICLVYTRI